jgi:hypothetical protein
LLNSSPYHAQANGQAKASNRTWIRLIKKKIDDYPRRWHEVLSKALWALRTSKHSATMVTAFELVYRQEAMLPREIILQTCRVIEHEAFSAGEYYEAMMNKLDEVPKSQFKALHEVEK